MRFTEAIVEELIKSGVISDNHCVQSITFFPPAPYSQYDCSVRVSQCGFLKDDIVLSDGGLIEAYFVIGNYINIVFNVERLINKLYNYVINRKCKYGFENNEYTGANVAIEHTSITPVYPINLATFRSSAVGEALKNLMLFWGANVNTHFFVEDLARQIDLLEYGFHKTNINLDQLEKNEKIDHLLGKIFVLAYLESHPYSPAVERLDEMFPFSRSTALDSIPPKDYHENDKEYLCNKCMDGIKQTLEDTGIEIDSFDLESTFTSGIILEAFKEPLIIQDLLQNSNRIPYYLRNCAYFSKMAGQYNQLFTVISDRQRATITDTLDALVNNNIHAVFFGDVLVSDDDETNVLDSIKEGTFHSVDQYLTVMTKLYCVSKDVIIDALKYKILSTKLLKGCFIDDSNIDQYNDYFRMMMWLRSYIDNDYKPRNILYLKYIKNEDRSCVIQIIKRIIQFEDVISKINNDFSFHHLTDYINTLYSDIKSASLKSKVVYIYLLREMIEDILQTSFKILDISF